MAKKNSSRDTSGGAPRSIKLISPDTAQRPKGDPGPENTDRAIYRERPRDPLGLLPTGGRKR